MSDNVKVSVLCSNCGGPIEIRNPTGKCDHLHWPDNVTPSSHVEASRLQPAAAVEAPGGDDDGVTDDMLTAAQERLCELHNFTSFDDHDIAEMYKAMRAIDPALRKADGEPVAWRWRFKTDPTDMAWIVINSPPSDITPNMIVEPLYAHPPSPAVGGEKP